MYVGMNYYKKHLGIRWQDIPKGQRIRPTDDQRRELVRRSRTEFMNFPSYDYHAPCDYAMVGRLSQSVSYMPHGGLDINKPLDWPTDRNHCSTPLGGNTALKHNTDPGDEMRDALEANDSSPEYG